MAKYSFRGIPYCLWNPYTPMDTFMKFFGFGGTVITRGEGHYLYNARGKRYINGNSATWNLAIGIGREEIIQAATEQMRELVFSSCWGSSHPRAIELAAKLVEISGGNYAHAYLGSNGSEAVETALKIARQFHRQSSQKSDRGRFKIISLREAYHGYTFGAVSAAGDANYADKFGPLLPGFVAIEPPYCYRCPYGKQGYPECGLLCAHELEKTIQAEGVDSVAAFILEPIMGNYGVIDPPEEYFKVVGETCRRNGVLLIADEVTTGFGRAGKLFFSQDWTVQPDLMCLGKIISGGYLPLAATLATEAVYQRFLGAGNYLQHGSTNSGHPVCAAVGLKAIEIIQRENLVENAASVGAYLKAGLVKLMEKHPIMGDVRGRGMMIAIELVLDRASKTPISDADRLNLMLDLGERGLLCSYGGFWLFPPLNIDEGIADEMLKIISAALGASKAVRMMRIAKEFVVSRVVKG